MANVCAASVDDEDEVPGDERAAEDAAAEMAAPEEAAVARTECAQEAVEAADEDASAGEIAGVE